MEIVQQFPSLSHSLFPPYPLLPAPAPRPLLSAPKIAGFLPANVPIPFADTVLMQNDPTPAPFVSKDRAKIPPELLDLIGHLPTPDELRHQYETRRKEIFDKLDARRRHYDENRAAYHKLYREMNP
jgi:hypothetical protein